MPHRRVGRPLRRGARQIRRGARQIGRGLRRAVGSILRPTRPRRKPRVVVKGKPKRRMRKKRKS